MAKKKYQVTLSEYIRRDKVYTVICDEDDNDPIDVARICQDRSDRDIENEDYSVELDNEEDDYYDSESRYEFIENMEEEKHKENRHLPDWMKVSNE